MGEALVELEGSTDLEKLAERLDEMGKAALDRAVEMALAAGMDEKAVRATAK